MCRERYLLKHRGFFEDCSFSITLLFYYILILLSIFFYCQYSQGVPWEVLTIYKILPRKLPGKFYNQMILIILFSFIVYCKFFAERNNNRYAKNGAPNKEVKIPIGISCVVIVLANVSIINKKIAPIAIEYNNIFV